MKSPRIIFVAGILSLFPSALNGWKKDLEKAFFQSEVLIFCPFYIHFQHKKIYAIAEELSELVDDGIPTILIAHSFGGILARSVIGRTKNANIQLLCTMASPHHMRYGGLTSAKQKLSLLDTIPRCHVFSFGGTFDIIVPYIFTQLDKASHEDIFTYHLGFLFSKKVRFRIIKKIKENIIIGKK